MITITTKTLADGTLAPATPIPADARAVVFDGANYTVYESTDTPPASALLVAGDTA